MKTLRLVLVVALALGGCDESEEGTDAGDAGSDAGPAIDAGSDAGPVNQYDGGPIVRIPESEASAARASCTYGRGAWPWQTIGEEHPIGDDIPIDHVIVLMQENRSFDHYFGTMPDEPGREIEGIPEGTTLPDSSGAPVAPFHADVYCVADPSHSWNGSHEEWNGGANDGFVRANDPNGERALGYLDGTDLPFYWDLAREFAFSDHHHCSMLGPTWVNRYYLLSGTSFGLIRNQEVPQERVPETGEHLILEQLDRAALSWRVYHDSVPFEFGGYPHYALHISRRRNVVQFDQFYEDLDAGRLPEVSFIEPVWDFVAHTSATDEHPPANPQHGQAWVREIVTRVMASSSWPRTAIILTYDEHGGFYDHVPPPEACPPGDYPPDLQAGDEPGGFDRLGFRVPLYVISPYSRPGYVSDRVTDHASVLRFIQTRFLLPAMTGRDANAWPLLDMFDFSTPALLTPPELDEAPIDPEEVTECEALFPE